MIESHLSSLDQQYLISWLQEGKNIQRLLMALTVSYTVFEKVLFPNCAAAHSDLQNLAGDFDQPHHSKEMRDYLNFAVKTIFQQSSQEGHRNSNHVLPPMKLSCRLEFSNLWTSRLTTSLAMSCKYKLSLNTEAALKILIRPRRENQEIDWVSKVW